jgi:hypothetical protein
MMDTFLSIIELPHLTQEDQNELEHPFTKTEIEKAISSLQSGKSPGDDGFPPGFYKEFKNLLIPLLMNVLNLVAEMPNLPDSFSTAIITVMNKKIKILYNALPIGRSRSSMLTINRFLR